MSRWPTKPLGEVCIAKSGNSKIIKGTLSTYNDAKLFPAYSATGQDVFSDGFDFEGDGIVISAVGARCGKCFLASGRWRAIANTHVILPKPDRANGRFLWYLLNDESFWVKGGTAQPFVKVVDSLKKQIPVPPLGEQERIVKLLDEADELRKLGTQADRGTAHLIPALFHEVFGGPATNPFNWPAEYVGNLFDQKRGGAKCGPFGSALKKHEYVESGIPVWGIPNILPNQFIEEGSQFISPSKFEELRPYSIESGDLLLSRAGTVGRICVARPKAKASIIGTNLIRLAVNHQRIVPDFFSALITHFGREVGRLRANSDEGAYSFMNTTVLKKLRIYVPPLPLQKEFAKRVTEIRELGAGQAASRERLDTLFQSMLHRAFRGEL